MSSNGGISYNLISSAVIGTIYTTTPLSINQSYIFYITTLATLGVIQEESIPSSTLTVNLPIIYTTTGTPSFSYNSGSIMLKYTINGTFNFNTNYDLSMEYTLVGGGGGGAFWYFTVGTSAGGGGQVLNTNGFSTVLKNNFTLVVGTGGLGATTSADGQLGTDSSISGTAFNVSTNNSLYAGQGGQSAVNWSYAGGGGPGGNVTSANGGIYDISISNGAGGAGGSLTIVDSNNMIISTTIGGQGQNSQTSSGGNGGTGQQGIDGIYYGGGGGGGATPSPNTELSGIGGSSSGGNGANNNPPSGTAAQDGQTAGGGGGGGCHNNQDLFIGLYPGNGANGIIIINFTNPP